MAYVPAAEGTYGADAGVHPSVINLDPSHPSYVSVPDAKFLFTAEFHCAGPDLALTGQNGERYLIPGYFSAQKQPDLIAPNGATLPSDLVHLLAGSVAPGQYAQTQPSAPPEAIGKVEKVVGSVTIIRNGVSVTVSVGDAVYKTDVVQTGANSSVGIGFPDGTALQIVANSRMALNDYSYDPHGTSNVALFSLVEGTFAFVAGKVAHTGHMQIATPAATMGIRGTTGYVQEAASITANAGNVSYSFVVVDDYASTNHGQYDLIDQSGNVLATVSQTEYITFVTPQGVGLPPLVSTQPMSNSQVAFGQQLIQQVFQTLNLVNNPNAQTNGANGSSTPPEQLIVPLLPQLIHDQGTTPLDLNNGGTGSTGSTGTVTVDIITPPPIITSNVIIWSSPSSGTFQTAPDWNTGTVPASTDTVEINNPSVVVTIDQVETINNLVLVPGVVVDIVNDAQGDGFLTILGGLNDGGLIEVGSLGADPKLEIIGATTVANGAQIESNGSDAPVDFQNNQVVNAGIIDATNGGTVSFEFVTVLNQPGGAVGQGSVIAQFGGTVTLDHSIVNNLDGGFNDGSLTASGSNSTVFLYDGTTVLGGSLSAINGGLIVVANGAGETESNVTFDGSQSSGGSALPVTIVGEVLIDGGTSLTLLGNIVNEGTINVDTTTLGADLVIDGKVTLSAGGAVTLTGDGDQITGATGGGTLDNIDNTISGAGDIVGTATNPLALENQVDGVIEANIVDAVLDIDTGTNGIVNAGLIEADGGTLIIESTTVTNIGSISVTSNSMLTLENDQITDTGGSITVDNGGTLTVDPATINGGTVTNDGGGTLSLTGGDTIENGTLGNAGALNVSGAGNAIENETGFTNTGSITVTSGGVLAFESDQITNGGGSITVDSGGTLTLDPTTINGGTVTNDSGGTLSLTGGDTIENGTLGNAGALNVSGAGNAIENESGFTNTGSITITSGGVLTFESDQITNGGGTVTVASGGTLTLDPTTINGGTVINDSGGTLSLTGGDTIESGMLGNAGAINVSGTGNAIENESGFTNTGSITITSGGVLTFESDQITNTGGSITVDNGGTLAVDPTTINGGTVTNDSGGTLSLTGGDTIENGTLDNAGALNVSGTGNAIENETGFTNTGSITITSGGVLALTDDHVSGDGQIVVDSGATLILTDAQISGAELINEGGTIEVFGDTTINTIQSLLIGQTIVESGQVLNLENELVLGSVTVDGSSGSTPAGVLNLEGDDTINNNTIYDGTTYNGPLTNSGRINVTGTNNVIENDDGTAPGGANVFTNAGTIEVASGGVLTLDNDQVTNAGGTIAVDGGGTLTLDPTTISGGTVTVDGLLNAAGIDAIDRAAITVASTGTLEATSGTLTIDPGSIDNSGLLEANGGALTIESTPVTNTGTLEATDHSTLTLSADSITNTGGTVQADAGSVIDLAGSTVTSGTVTVDGTLDSTGTSAINGAAITVASTGTLEATSGTLTIDPGSIDNSGLLEANGGALTIESTPVTNTGTLEATDHSTLTLSDDSVTNTGGTVQADAGSVIDLAGSTITSGTVAVDGTLDSTGTSSISDAGVVNVGTLEATSGTLTLSDDSVTNTGGTVQADAESVIDLAGSTVTSGTVTVDGTLDSTGTSAINGAAITVASTGTLEATSGTLTIDPGSIDNSGLLEANGGALTIESTPVTNTGTLKATGDSTLTLSDDSVTNTGGTVQADAGSVIDLAGSTITSGTLTVDGTLDSTGTSSISDASVVNVGTLEATSETLTIDPGSIDNRGLVEANGGALTIDATPVINSGTLEASNGGTLTLLGTTVTNTPGYTPQGTPSPAAYTFVGTGADVVATFVGGSAGDTSVLEMSVNGGPYILSTINNQSSGIGETYDFGFVAAGTVITFAILNEDTGSTLSSNAALNADGDQHVWAFNYTQGTLGFTNIDSGLALNFKDVLAAQGSDWDYNDFQVVVTGAVNQTPLPSSATVEVAGGSLLNLEGSSITAGTVEGHPSAFSSGTVDVYGTLNSTGTSSISDDSIFNTGTLEATSGTLTIDPGSIDNSGLLEANGGALTIESTPVTNTGTLEATDHSTLTLSADSITNTGGTVQADAGSVIDLAGSTVTSGTVTVDGTLDSTGTSAINGAAITVASTGTLEATSGTLTIDPGSIDNSGLLEANGGALTIESTPVTNTGTLEATDHSTLTLSADSITNTGGTVQADAGSVIDLAGSTITSGTVTVDGTLDSTGTSAINGAAITVASTGTLEATSGTLTIDPGSINNSGLLLATDDSTLVLDDNVTNSVPSGTVQVDVGSTLDLENATISGGIVSIGGLLNSVGTSSLTDTAITNVGTIESTSGKLIIDPGSIDNSGFLDAKGAALEIDSPLNNSGTLEATNGGALVVDSGVSVNNSGGTIYVGLGSTVDIAGSISGGSAVIDGGTLTYGGNSNVATVIDGLGTLVLDSNHFAGTLYFEYGDVVDLAAIAYQAGGPNRTELSYNSHTDTLTVGDGSGGPSITLQLVGNYQGSNFALSQDGTGTALTLRSGEGSEPPSLSLGSTTATVNEGGTVVLPSIKVTPVDSDDVITVTITGLPSGATITDSADSTVFSGSRITLTGAEVGSKLTLHDGSNAGNFALTVMANNTTDDGTGGEEGSSAPQTIAVAVNTSVGPAGVAGSAINLGLANQSMATGGPVTVTVSGLPSDWQLNDGTNLGNGSWTLQADDLTTLMVLTAATYLGGVQLNVTESWTNADGSVGLASFADNVETYAPGSPIFAWSGNDTLTGAGGNQEFVFAQPIASDTVYNFNPASDKIDLVGFENLTGFAALQDHIVNDGNGDAVITLGPGETISLHGVNAASLTAADFVFDQTPLVNNAGTITVDDGATLPLSGIVDNSGTIALDGTGHATELQILGDGITLEGGGQITLSDSPDNAIVGTALTTVLTNVDNNISGVGQIGSGNGNLTLINEAHGTIAADIAGGVLSIDTGQAVVNDGLLEATNGGSLQIHDAVSGNGHALIEGGTMTFDAAANVNVTFDNGTGAPAYGELVLGDASAFSGQISGFTGTAPDAAHSDVIDITTIDYDSASFSENYKASNGLLTVSDGTTVANFTLSDFSATLSFASDGKGGTLITDPPVTPQNNPTGAAPVSIGGPGNDSFVFAPQTNAGTISNGHSQQDAIDLDQLGNAHAVQELQSLVSADAHIGSIDLAHHDGGVFVGITDNQLHALLQSGVHLH